MTDSAKTAAEAKAKAEAEARAAKAAHDAMASQRGTSADTALPEQIKAAKPAMHFDRSVGLMVNSKTGRVPVVGVKDVGELQRGEVCGLKPAEARSAIDKGFAHAHEWALPEAK